MKLILIFITYFLFQNFLFASVGSITSIRGKAWAIRGQYKHILVMNDILHKGDQIITLKNSYLKIMMNDKSIFTIGPHSHLNIKKINSDSLNKNISFFQLVHGLLRSYFSRKTKSIHTIIKTETVSLGVRGTELILEVHKKDKEHVSKIALLTGDLEVHALHHQKEKSEKFKLGVGHHFNSQIFHKKGFTAAHQKLNNHHLDQLKNNKDHFIHDIHNQGQPYPIYSHPAEFKNLKTLIKKN